EYPQCLAPRGHPQSCEWNARVAPDGWSFESDAREEESPGMMKAGLRSQLELILFLFRVALRGKECATRGLQSFPSFSRYYVRTVCVETLSRTALMTSTVV